MRHKRVIRSGLIVVFLAAIAIAVGLLKGCAQKTDSLETVRIGAATPLAGLVYIAHEKGFFMRHGVRTVIRDYELGAVAAKDLLANAIDFATATEFIMVQQGFDNNTLRVFAQIANTKNTELIARQDHGIEKLPALKSKRIGLARGSIADFFLGSFLKHNNMPISSVKIVDLAPSAIEKALYNGTVDAVVIWEPHATRIKERLGKNAISWPVQGRDDYYFLLITKEEFLRHSPSTAEKMLRALIDAEDFAGRHPEETQRIIEAKLRLRPGDAQLVLARSTLKVRLDQSLLTGMEAEAQWMIRNNLTTKKEMPNYLNMIDLKPLGAVKPDAVGIIH